MKRQIFLVLGFLFLMTGFVSAANGVQSMDGSGEFHEEMILQGGQNGEGLGERQPLEKGTMMNQFGQEISVMGEGQNLRIQSGNLYANCSECNLTQERVQNMTRIYAQLSNGKNAEIKVMPDRASENALNQLRIRVCDEECRLELKEVGEGDETKLAYEIGTTKRARFLGIFGTDMEVSAQVDVETGEVLETNKPWWAFLASEK